jgi:outer membrane protein
MMKKVTTLLLSMGLMSSINLVSATDLLGVFHQAQTSDPTYQKAKSTYLSAETTVGQARSAFLPNLSLTGTYGQTKTDTTTTGNFAPGTGSTTTNSSQSSAEGTLTLQQSLFNWANFKNYAKAKLAVKQAAATYSAAEQDLILRTASAYFSVLTAEEVLRYTASQKRQLARNLEVTRQRYKVGLDAITSVYDAQAKYDATKATYIAKANDLADKKEALRVITGQLYSSLSELKDQIPLLRPTPADINEWTKTAEAQNLSLMAARFGAQAALQNEKATFAGHLPTLGLQGTYDDTNTKNLNTTNGTTDAKSTGINATLTVPIFAGGNVSYQTKQAEYDYQTALAQMDITHRQTIASARQAYLGVLAEISQIQADRQAIKSARSSLASNEAAYKVGTRTILDVLTAQSTLYDAETKYATDRFQYVINYLTLKQAAGTLNEQDVAEINNWLVSPSAAKPVMHKKPVVKHKAKKTVKKVTNKKTASTKNK